MKSDLIWGIVFTILAIVCLACTILNVIAGNYALVPLTLCATFMDGMTATKNFVLYNRYKDFF